MKRLIILFCALLWSAGLNAAEPPASFADLAKRLLPSVVNVSSKMGAKPIMTSEGEVPIPLPPGDPLEGPLKEFFKQNPQAIPKKSLSLGSGFIIDPSGYILTNNHVITGSDDVEITVSDGRILKANIVGVDKKTDLAVLKVDSKTPLPAIKWGNSAALEIGDWTLVIGNPFGLGGTVTAGIISAKARDINAGPYDDFIQTDASINRGNSGGPMFNMNGEVIGISTAIFSPNGGSIGLGFAVPSNMAMLVADQLQKFGRTKRGWLGVQIQPVTKDLADVMGISESTGALVSFVTPGSPAATAGIMPGDLILSFNGHEVNSSRKLPRLVAEGTVNKEVEITFQRKSQKKICKAKLGELESIESTENAPKQTPAKDQKDSNVILGLSVAPLTPQVRTSFNIDKDLDGILVAKILIKERSGDIGLRPGDVIVAADDAVIKTIEDFSKRINEARSKAKKAVLLRIYRQGEFTFIALPLDAASNQ